MTILEETKKAIINKDVTHQGIGGKEITIERELSLEEVLDMGNIAAANFMDRRMDLVSKGIISESEIKDITEGKYTLEDYNKRNDEFFNNTKCYYGHVGNLGYFVCEDEIEFI